MTRLVTGLCFLLATAALSVGQEKDKGPVVDPKSNNKDKIIGKWKFTEFGGKDKKAKADFEQLAKLGLFITIEFQTDGKLVMAIGSEDAKLLEVIKMSTPNKKIAWEAKYKLLAGDKIEVYDAKDDLIKSAFKDGKATSDAVIKADEMVMKDPDGAEIKLTRIKDKPKP